MKSFAITFLFVILAPHFPNESTSVPTLSENQEKFLQKIRSVDGCTALRLVSYCADMLKIGSFKIKQTNEIAVLQRILMQRDVGICTWGEWGWKATAEQCIDELITNYQLSSLAKTKHQEHFHKFWVDIFNVGEWCNDNLLHCQSALMSATRGQSWNKRTLWLCVVLR